MNFLTWKKSKGGKEVGLEDMSGEEETEEEIAELEEKEGVSA